MTLESALAEMEMRTQAAGASAKKLSKAILSARRASTGGDIAAMKKALADARDMLRVVEVEFADAVTAWPFDEEQEQDYFESGHFTRELLAAAGEIELAISEEDGRLMCYPSVIRVDPGRRLVTVDKKPHRAVRPSVLAAHLRAQQTKTVRFKAGPFLEALYAAWKYARHADGKGKGPLRDVPVDRIYAVLTVAPGSGKEYSRQEFGRDLFLLESSGERRTRKEAEIHFSRSTGTKGGRGVITIVREDGKRVLYSSISFQEAAANGS
ncbi:MAG: hypothetical protein M5U22_18395 [Thermoleophilia bacterium]|nr:hypothetical protein [Thermoleophilia bacterium]